MPEALRQLAQRMLEAAFEVTTATGNLIDVVARTELLLLLAPHAVVVVAAAATEVAQATLAARSRFVSTFQL